MIQFSDKSLKSVILSMWKSVFGDKDEYIDLIFEKKYRDENTSIYFSGEKAVASLQMFPYTIRYYNKVLPFYYLGGLCTLPEYRNKGYMGELILDSFRTMQSRNIPLAILVPAEEWLFGYYEKYGFVQTFDKGDEAIDMPSLLKEYDENPEQAYRDFDSCYQQANICVLKSKDDLRTILEEYVLDGQPEKFNLPAMSRIIDPLYLLEIYAENNPELSFNIKLSDEKLKIEDTYVVKNGKVIKDNTSQADFETDEKLFIRLLLGYRIDELPEKYHPFFRKNKPVINLMLE